MKKILKSIFVCIIIITTLLASVNYIKADDSEATYDGIKYKINTAERWATVCGYTGTDKDVKIPNMIGRGIIVSEIADHAFDGCSTIRVLTIPDTIMKVGDMSFIGMDNLQAIISRTEGINIVVKENVQIVSDRSELGDIDMDSNNTSGNNSNGNSGNSGSADNNSGNNRIEDAKSVDGGGIIIDSDTGIITDSSNGNIQIGSNVDSESSDSAKNEISDGNGVISDNKTNNTADKSDNNKNEAGASQSNKSSTTKVVVTIICIILVAGLAAGLFIYMKKKKR